MTPWKAFLSEWRLTYQGRWRSRLFTTSGTWVVPADVGCIWVDGCAGGAGGGGGNSTPGGGGGGGCSGMACKQLQLSVTHGEILTITIGDKGNGGSANADGTLGGSTTLTLASDPYSGIRLDAGAIGAAGANPNGGNGGGSYSSSYWGSYIATAVGGAAGGASGGYVYAPKVMAPWNGFAITTGGSAGGALSNSGGVAYGARSGQPQAWNDSALVAANPSTGNASGGGGGHGGATPFGYPGKGGSNGAAGANAVGYGCGGGGGSGNSAGGNGSPGMIRIYCFTAYAI